MIGFGYGLAFPAMQTLMVNLSGHHQRGTAISTCFTAFDVGVDVGMYLGGKIAEMTGFSWAFIIGALFNVAAVFYFIFIAAPHYTRHHAGTVTDAMD